MVVVVVKKKMMMMLIMMKKKRKKKKMMMMIMMMMKKKKKFKEKFGSCTRKTLDRFTTKDSYTWNITHNTKSTAA